MAIYAQSGVPIIDQVMPVEYILLNQAFRVNPDFAFFDDGASPNALATTTALIGRSAYGTVLFGVNLLRAEMGATWWGAAVAGIASHEFAHICQFQAGLSGPTWMMELHADYLAGWYLGAKQVYGTAVVIDGFGESLFNKGDFAFNDPSHHGTPEQRVSAMLNGYRTALSGVLDLGVAFNQGMAMFRGLRRRR